MAVQETMQEIKHEATTLSDAEPSVTGYQPRAMSKNTPSDDKKKATNTLESGNLEARKSGCPLPSWWPLIADGKPIFHVYRLKD